MYMDPLNAYGPVGGPDLEGYLNRPDVQKALNADSSLNKAPPLCYLLLPRPPLLNPCSPRSTTWAWATTATTVTPTSSWRATTTR